MSNALQLIRMATPETGFRLSGQSTFDADFKELAKSSYKTRLQRQLIEYKQKHIESRNAALIFLFAGFAALFYTQMLTDHSYSARHPVGFAYFLSFIGISVGII